MTSAPSAHRLFSRCSGSAAFDRHQGYLGHRMCHLNQVRWCFRVHGAHVVLLQRTRPSHAQRAAHERRSASAVGTSSLQCCAVTLCCWQAEGPRDGQMHTQLCSELAMRHQQYESVLRRIHLCCLAAPTVLIGSLPQTAAAALSAFKVVVCLYLQVPKTTLRVQQQPAP